MTTDAERTQSVIVEEEDDTDSFGRPMLRELHRDSETRELVRTVERDSVGRVTGDFHLHAGALHCLDGPALRTFVNGELAQEEWRRFGKAHRVDGPAVVFYAAGPSVSKTTKHWCIRGVRYGSVREVAERITRKSTDSEDLWTEFIQSRFGPFVEDRRSVAKILVLVNEGITTVEGVRAALDGAPVDWVLAFERGIVPDQTTNPNPGDPR